MGGVTAGPWERVRRDGWDAVGVCGGGLVPCRAPLGSAIIPA